MTPSRTSLIAFALIGLTSASARAETIQVIVDKLVFSPAEVKAKVGDTIEWINKDMLAHTATAVDGAWNVMIAPKKNAALVLTKAGPFDYFCKFHPNMKGRVVVAP